MSFSAKPSATAAPLGGSRKRKLLSSRPSGPRESSLSTLQKICLQSVAANIERHPPDCWECIDSMTWNRILEQRIRDRQDALGTGTTKKVPDLSAPILIEIEELNEHLVCSPASEVVWKQIVDYKHKDREGAFTCPFDELCTEVSRQAAAIFQENSDQISLGSGTISYLLRLPVSGELLKVTGIGKKLGNHCRRMSNDEAAQKVLEKWRKTIESQRKASNTDDCNNLEDPGTVLSRCRNWRSLFYHYSEYFMRKKEISATRMKEARAGFENNRKAIASLDEKESMKFSRKRARQEHFLAGKSGQKLQRRIYREFLQDDPATTRKNNFLSIRKMAKLDHGRRMRVDPTLKSRSNGNGNSSANFSCPPLSLSTIIKQSKQSKSGKKAASNKISISTLKTTGVIQVSPKMKMVVPNKEGVFYQQRFQKQQKQQKK